jgi:UDP-N-acetyl-2-amino-2-deoxyglucuronate dehydrogenase
LLWIFGAVKENRVTLHNNTGAAGELELENATVNWMLSIDEKELPAPVRAAGKQTYRALTVNDEVLEFSGGFTGLHTKSYEEILKGNGVRLAETKKVIELVQETRQFS